MVDYLLVGQLAQLFKQWSSHFFTFHIRPIKSEGQQRFSDLLKRQPKTAVLIQGPLITENDFTCETIKLYKQIFPGSTIIVSTWKTSDDRALNKIKHQGVELILNDLPLHPGPSNINYQIASTRVGLRHAQKLHCRFVLRTRSDQRIYATSIMEFLLNMSDRFAISPGLKQKNRLIMSSLDSFKYRLYSVSDMVIFGHIDDLLLYYSVRYDERKSVVSKKSLLAISKQNICEIYLATHFLKQIGFKINWTLKNSWRAYAECFAIIDSETLDLYWPKYEKLREYRHRRYASISNKQQLDFKEWFNLYVNLANKKLIPEKTLLAGIDDLVRYL